MARSLRALRIVQAGAKSDPRDRDAARTIGTAAETPLYNHPSFGRHDDIEAVQLNEVRDMPARGFKLAHDVVLELSREFVHRVEQVECDCHGFPKR